MKSSQKIKRLQLENNHEDEIILLGLVSAEPDYKLSLSINKLFGISLKNTTPVKINDPSREELAFSRFSDLSNSPETVFSLVSNRSGKNYLLKKLVNIDYIFIIHNPENNSNIVKLTSQFREIETISAVFNIDLNIFRDKNLLYLTH
jgi:hypothetical protein